MLWWVKKAKVLLKSSALCKNYFLRSKDSKVDIEFQEIMISTDAFILDHVIGYIITKYKAKGDL